MSASMAVNWHLKLLPLSSLTAWHKNPRQLSQAQYEQIQTSLEKFGLIDKPVVNADADNTVIGGHQRLRILHDQGVREVECWVPGQALSEREVEECNIRLNRNLGSWDFDILANEFEIEDLLDWGFSEIELQIDGLADAVSDGSDDGSANGDGTDSSCSYELIVYCESDIARTRLVGRLCGEGYTCRVVEAGTPTVAAVSDFDVPEIQW